MNTSVVTCSHNLHLLHAIPPVCLTLERVSNDGDDDTSVYMHVYKCIHVCIYICVCVHVHMHWYVCAFACNTCRQACTCLSLYAYNVTDMYVSVNCSDTEEKVMSSQWQLQIYQQY